MNYVFVGAGVASVLALLLKPMYPEVKCYCYGTPGSTFDTTTSRECRDYIFNISHHNDMIPLLSLRSVSKLRCEILDSITRAKVNKMVIMQGLFREYVAQVDDLLYSSGQEPVSEFSRSVHAFNVRYNHFISFHLFIFVSFRFIYSFLFHFISFIIIFSSQESMERRASALKLVPLGIPGKNYHLKRIEKGFHTKKLSFFF
jgi:hypothetical protein